jgi:2-polyprenyl-6-methoxyphenol hydroxylase-like FAD-dependent oxidoreductase
MRNQLFHIAGGGIAGVASALAVAKSGNSAFVMEKAAKLEMIGAGLQLGPNAVRALQKLDAWDAVEPHTASPQEIVIRDGRSGKILKRLELGKKFETRFGTPYRVAHRADLLQGLLNVAQSKSAISITTNAEYVARDQFEGHALIAADGVWSKTREVMFRKHKVVLATDVIFRNLSSTNHTATPAKAGAQLSSSESEAQRDPCLRRDDGNLGTRVVLWLYPGGHVVHYEVANKLNLVVVTQGENPDLHFVQACDELREILSNRDWSKWPAAYVPPLKTWHKNNVTLIGDAAHGTLPYLAQGAAMSLEDAVSLQDAIEQHQKITDAFSAFGKMRMARTKRVHGASLRMGKIYHTHGAAALARNFAIKHMPSHLQDLQMAWIYDGA